MNEVRRRLETDLAAIRTVMASGQLKDAERMLAGVSLNVSPASEFSKRIGDLYLQLGFPVMAGRYWYLLDDKSDRMLAACNEFERSLGNNPVLIAEAIGWLSAFSPYAKARFQDLHEKARELRRTYQYDVTPPKGWRDRVALWGAASLALLPFSSSAWESCSS